MNSAAQIALGADSISDTFTAPVTNDTEDKTLDSTGTDLEVAVTADAARASQAKTAERPRRIPRHEPWDGHENINPGGHTPSATASIEAPSPEVRSATPQIDQDSDIRDYSETSGIYNAQDPYVTNADGERVRESFNIDQVSATNTDNVSGNQPADPVPVNDMQAYMLSELIKGLGLDPATCLNSANPADLPPGAVLSLIHI